MRFVEPALLRPGSTQLFSNQPVKFEPLKPALIVLSVPKVFYDATDRVVTNEIQVGPVWFEDLADSIAIRRPSRVHRWPEAFPIALGLP